MPQGKGTYGTKRVVPQEKQYEEEIMPCGACAKNRARRQAMLRAAAARRAAKPNQNKLKTNKKTPKPQNKVSIQSCATDIPHKSLPTPHPTSIFTAQAFLLAYAFYKCDSAHTLPRNRAHRKSFQYRNSYYPQPPWCDPREKIDLIRKLPSNTMAFSLQFFDLAPGLRVAGDSISYLQIHQKRWTWTAPKV